MLAPKSYAFRFPHTAENNSFLQSQAHDTVHHTLQRVAHPGYVHCEDVLPNPSARRIAQLAGFFLFQSATPLTITGHYMD